jgi:hypothetical protein
MRPTTTLPSFRRLTLAAALSLALPSLISLAVDDALAQSGFASNKDISTAEAAQKLLQDPNTDNSAVSSSLAEPQTADPGAAAPRGKTIESEIAMMSIPKGAKLVVVNCSGAAIKARSYNPADIVYLVPFTEKTIADGNWGDLDCASKKCKVKIGEGKPTDPVSGIRIFRSGKLTAVSGTPSCGS